MNSRRSTKTAGSGKPAGTPRTTRTGTTAGGKGTVTVRRAASTTSANARSQAKRDRQR